MTILKHTHEKYLSVATLTICVTL